MSTSTNEYNENTLDEFDGFLPSKRVLTLSWLFVVAAIILSITSCIICCCQSCRQNRQPDRYNANTNPTGPVTYPAPSPIPPRTGVQSKHIALVAATFFLVIVSFLLAGYATARRVLDVQDYKGPMRLVGWSTNGNQIYTTEHHADEGEKSVHGRTHWWEHSLRVEFQVDWGYEWGCPDHNDQVCISSNVKESSPTCENIICSTTKDDYACSEEEFQAALEAVTNCANAIFDPQGVDKGFYEPYTTDPTQGPSQDVNWPHLVAYGNCNNCHVTTTAPRAHVLKGFRAAVLVLWVVSVSLVTASLVWVCRNSRTKDNSNNHTIGINTLEMVESAPVVASSSPVVVTAIPEQQHYVYNNNNNNIVPEAPVVYSTAVVGNEPEIAVYGQPVAYPTHNNKTPYY
mmetsp:Transcript_13100/g.24819  ORF Transcript_13100/g.24819 Transcript_13100/m.24819 type:complete len:400 (-) Transcript_13100:204-1403(-)